MAITLNDDELRLVREILDSYCRSVAEASIEASKRRRAELVAEQKKILALQYRLDDAMLPDELL